MSRKQSKAALEGNGPFFHRDEFGSGELTMMVGLYNFDRQVERMKSHFGRQDKTLGEHTEKMRATNPCLAGLQHFRSEITSRHRRQT